MISNRFRFFQFSLSMLFAFFLPFNKNKIIIVIIMMIQQRQDLVEHELENLL